MCCAVRSRSCGALESVAAQVLWVERSPFGLCENVLLNAFSCIRSVGRSCVCESIERNQDPLAYSSRHSLGILRELIIFRNRIGKIWFPLCLAFGIISLTVPRSLWGFLFSESVVSVEFCLPADCHWSGAIQITISIIISGFRSFLYKRTYVWLSFILYSICPLRGRELLTLVA